MLKMEYNAFHFCLGLACGFFPLISRTVYISYFPYSCRMIRPSHLILPHLITPIKTVQLIMRFSPTHLEPNICPSTMFSKILNLVSKQQAEAMCSSLHSLFTPVPADDVLIYA
jgi:hypothetical protein